MSIVTSIFKILSQSMLDSLESNRREPDKFQDKWFGKLMANGSQTSFGKEHGFTPKTTYRQFSNQVPLRNYDMIEPYIIRTREGQQNVLWNSPVTWFAKSSGTSSAKSKFIPVTKESLHTCHYAGMQKMLATYVHNNPSTKIFDGDALTLGGSVTPDELGTGKSNYGDLSAILLSNSPFWVELRRVPNKKSALTSDFEKKVKIICENALKYNVTNFSGVPSWNLVLIKRILEYTGKSNLKEVWPNLELFMHGGINFEPYRNEYKKILPGYMNYMENYNASEGYFAFQDDPADKSMLLLTDNGVFYEFIPLEMLEKAISGNYTSFETVQSVKTGVNYALVITTNGGLWRYLIGDSIMFTSLSPHKFIITGRTQLYINAFGEELMIHNAEKALAEACNTHNITVNNYTVAPVFMAGNKKGYHQWLVEFENEPENIESFRHTLDNAIRSTNSDYDAKRTNDTTMTELQIVTIKKGVFYKWFFIKGKLGGQNKVPRLSNDRKYATELLELNHMDNADHTI
ncbi:MAG: GH3 auxin-responsive promoter family protein [Bacteroidales bacterium]|jgi:hypothetical protein|nr:GH3 auxin-responsive promoter family protein [Bacteroidales bacterium]MDD3300221.1 GH3 auxin-responsive promoter family protein [Bacteroidales bacterium]MDD3843532.1 GH3 auxin-responsive promoter family protein [Bacteroidales bacterium]MDD4617900.1 GH3 auxin-responsive promoter family protein [Bacteroidales bacterium]